MNALSDLILAMTPVSYWRMGEASGSICYDLMGAHNGTYTNGPLLAQAGLVTGDTNTAVKFDGINDYVALTSTLNNATSPVTICMIVDLDATKTSGIGSLIELGGKYGGKRIDVNYSTREINAYTLSEADVKASIPFSSAVLLTVVYDLPNTTRKIYINGALAATGPCNATAGNYGSFRIGAHTLNNYYSKALIDEVSLFNRALSASEIAYIYDVWQGAMLPSISISLSKTLVANDFFAVISEFETGSLVQRVPVSSGLNVLDVFPPRTVLVTVLPDYGLRWADSHGYVLNDRVYPSDPISKPYYYKRLTAGTSGTTEPTWPTTPGGKCDDGGVTDAWELVERLVQPITHGPLIPS